MVTSSARSRRQTSTPDSPRQHDVEDDDVEPGLLRLPVALEPSWARRTSNPWSARPSASERAKADLVVDQEQTVHLSIVRREAGPGKARTG